MSDDKKTNGQELTGNYQTQFDFDAFLAENYEDVLDNFLESDPDKVERDFINKMLLQIDKKARELLSDHERAEIEITGLSKKDAAKIIELRDWQTCIAEEIGGLARQTRFLNTQLSRLPAIVENADFEKEIILSVAAKEKVRYLIALGVIDELKSKQPFLSSTNLLAKYIARITGEKQNTIQPYLDSYFVERLDNKNPTTPSAKGKDPMKHIYEQLKKDGFSAK